MVNFARGGWAQASFFAELKCRHATAVENFSESVVEDTR